MTSEEIFWGFHILAWRSLLIGEGKKCQNRRRPGSVNLPILLLIKNITIINQLILHTILDKIFFILIMCVFSGRSLKTERYTNDFKNKQIITRKVIKTKIIYCAF